MNAVRLWFCALLLGPAVGSFCGLLLTRLPRRLSPLTPASTCLACGHRLSVAELIPILSFLWLRGRCRHCGAAIPRLHLTSELGCTAGACAGALLGGWWGLLAALLAAVGLSVTAGRSLRAPFASERGTALLEVALAATLAGIVLVPVLAMLSVSTNATVLTGQRTQAMTLALAKLEECRSLGFSALQSQMESPGNCSGTETGLQGGFTRTTSLVGQDPTGSNLAIVRLKVTVQSTGRRAAPISTLVTLVGQGE